MGTPRPISVSAQMYRNFEHLLQDPVFDVEDAAFDATPALQLMELIDAIYASSSPGREVPIV